jgi:hypothetical protein
MFNAVDSGNGVRTKGDHSEINSQNFESLPCEALPAKQPEAQFVFAAGLTSVL